LKKISRFDRHFSVWLKAGDRKKVNLAPLVQQFCHSLRRTNVGPPEPSNFHL